MEYLDSSKDLFEEADLISDLEVDFIVWELDFNKSCKKNSFPDPPVLIRERLEVEALEEELKLRLLDLAKSSRGEKPKNYLI